MSPASLSLSDQSGEQDDRERHDKQNDKTQVLMRKKKNRDV